MESLRVNFSHYAFECVCYKFFYLRYDVSVHIEIVFWILHLYNPTEITKSHLVSTLELPVVISMNLNCIICKVDKRISHVIMVELLTHPSS